MSDGVFHVKSFITMSADALETQTGKQIFRVKLVNLIVVDTLVTYVTKASTAMILIMYIKLITINQIQFENV